MFAEWASDWTCRAMAWNSEDDALLAMVEESGALETCAFSANNFAFTPQGWRNFVQRSSLSARAASQPSTIGRWCLFMSRATLFADVPFVSENKLPVKRHCDIGPDLRFKLSNILPQQPVGMGAVAEGSYLSTAFRDRPRKRTMSKRWL